MTNVKFHYFNLHLTVAYVREDVLKSRDLNMILASNKKTVNDAQLNDARRGAAQQILQQFGLPEENILDVTINGPFYLGHMTEQEFSGEKVDPGKAYAQTH